MSVSLRDPLVLKRGQWLALRNEPGHIGASQVPSILGLDPYQSAWSLWCEMTGRTEPKPVTAAMQSGLALEPVISNLYKEETGRELYDPGRYAVWQDEALPWLSCTIDRLMVHGDYPVELKHAGRWHSSEWYEPEAPKRHQAQVQMQMRILGKAFGSIAGLPDTLELRYFDIQYDDEFVAEALYSIEAFHKCVIDNVPPEIDGHPATTAAIRRLTKESPADSRVVVLTGAHAQAAIALQAVKEMLKKVEAEKDKYQNVVMEALRDATHGTVPGVINYSFKTSKAPEPKLVIPWSEKVEELLINHSIPFTTSKREPARPLIEVKNLPSEGASNAK